MPKLFMLLIGCKPRGRNTEQHDVFFGIGNSVKDLLPAINEFWPEVKNKFHVDGWREVTLVDGYRVSVHAKEYSKGPGGAKLFFINLGGYKPGEFEEFHYKMLAASEDNAGALTSAKKTAFYKHAGFKTAPSHIDDKYGIDVDDAYEIKDILSDVYGRHYSIELSPAPGGEREDVINLGYYTINSFK